MSRRKMVRGQPWIVALFIAATITVGWATAASAGPLNCRTCTEYFDMYKHKFTGECGDELSPFCMNCSTFNSCHTDPQNGLCRQFHWQCFKEVAALDALEGSLKSGGVVDPNGLAQEFPETIEVHQDGYLLVLNCDGAVVRALQSTT